ncbi:MAG TPA: hypothetical protein VGI03_11215 [Verrucomicrobiae bacterium]|jgi:hypothetical protein
MKTAKVVLLGVVGLFLLGVGCGIWIGHYCAEDKVFKVEYLHTNDWSGIGFFEAKTERPIWIKWNLSHGGGSMEKYYSQGHDVFDVALSSNRLPIYSVYFRNPDKSVTWWIARSGTNFDDRIFYDTNGNFSKRQIWYSGIWQTINKRDGKGGIVIDGLWRPLQLFTNGMWTIGTSTNP